MMNTQRGNTPMTDTQKLKGLIVSAGKTQKDVAKETGISANCMLFGCEGTTERSFFDSFLKNKNSIAEQFENIITTY